MLLLLIVLSAVSYLGTCVVMRSAEKRGLLDRPNERSSHVCPTPRGGGLAIVVAFLFGCIGVWLLGFISETLFISLFLSSSLVAGIGFIDDHGHVSAKIRLLMQLVAVVILGLGIGWPYDLSSVSPTIFYLLVLIISVGGVWIINLVNFMDGIDGLVAAQMLLFALMMGSYAWFVYDLSSFVILCLITVSAIMGFLTLNFPPAKVFMGDVGSGFLGVIAVAFLLLAWHEEFRLFVAALILLGVLVVDSTFTLVRRLISGQNVFQAHRLHAYQKLSIVLNSHKKVTLGMSGFNFLWLYPLGWLVIQTELNCYMAVALAYIPLIFLALFLRAGELDKI